MTGRFKILAPHLKELEAESIHIFREVVAETENPVMLYSVGKDSSVMLHLARKAFYPSPPPFPLMHVDTTWKFQEMYKLRDKAAKEIGMELIVYQNKSEQELKLVGARAINSWINYRWKADGRGGVDGEG